MRLILVGMFLLFLLGCNSWSENQIDSFIANCKAELSKSNKDISKNKSLDFCNCKIDAVRAVFPLYDDFDKSQKDLINTSKDKGKIINGDLDKAIIACKIENL